VSWYEFLLFAHISMAVVWIGGGLMMQMFGLRATMSGDRERLRHLGEDIEWIGQRLFIPASLLAFLTGILLVVESDFYGFGDDWIVIGLVLYATTFLTGLLFLGPEAGRVGKLAAEGSQEAGPRTARLIMVVRLDLVLLFVMLYDMAVKPDFGDAGSILWGLAGAALVAGAIVWRYRATMVEAPSGATTERV
jgi:uncharacterized membrane protein